jgi:predicted alpha/beta superfamily hydrolase
MNMGCAMTRMACARRWDWVLFGLVGAVVPMGCTSAPAAHAPGNVHVAFHVRVPADTPRDAKVCISGSLKALGGWKADGLVLRREIDGTYRGEVFVPRGGVLAFKVTRGSWQFVEKDPRGEEIPNREIFLERDRLVDIEVETWAREDAAAEPRSLAGIIRFHEDFLSHYLKRPRRLAVYLPPNYEAHPEARYPVLYLHDGQNVFDQATAALGVEWRADETAERLIREGRIRPLIIVAIESTPERIDEFTPHALGTDRREAKGDLYARFVAEEVKPFIDRTYRTRPGRADTAVAGSSLGGLISLHIAARYPDIFSMCGAISPALWWQDERMLKLLEAKEADAWLKRERFWVDMGTAEGARPGTVSRELPRTRRLAARLAAAGLVAERDYVYREVLGASHGEAAWAARFDEILTFFFPGPNATPSQPQIPPFPVASAPHPDPSRAMRGGWGERPPHVTSNDGPREMR